MLLTLGARAEDSRQILILTGGRFATKTKRTFKSSQDADKQLEAIKQRYNLSDEAIIERLLTR